MMRYVELSLREKNSRVSYKISKFTHLKIEFEILFFQLNKISFKILKF